MWRKTPKWHENYQPEQMGENNGKEEPREKLGESEVSPQAAGPSWTKERKKGA